MEVERVRKEVDLKGRERSSREVALLKEELVRKGEEVVRQREETATLVARCC